MLSKISQTEKDKHCVISLAYGTPKNQNKYKPVSLKTILDETVKIIY